MCSMELFTSKEKKDLKFVNNGIIEFRDHINKETGESWIEIIDLQNSYTCSATIPMEKGQVLFCVPRTVYSIYVDPQNH